MAIKTQLLEGRQTLNDSLNSLVGSIGVQTEHENKPMEHPSAIVDQLDNYERSIAGVNLDGEANNMMHYQAAFNASAKAMKVGDELLETILTLR